MIFCDHAEINLTLRSNVFVLLLILFPLKAIAVQTCDPNVLPTAPDSRFQDNGDGTVTDFYTGLMWQRCSIGDTYADCLAYPVSKFMWNSALLLAPNLNQIGGFAGYTDWRLPNIKELRSLIEFACINPAMNINVFHVNPGTYGSSSPMRSNSYGVWGVNFDTGASVFLYRSYYSYHYSLRLVRGGS